MVPDSSWEVGIVFPGEETRVAFPLKDADVNDAKEIREIKTSCECTRAVGRNFVDFKGARGVAIQFNVLDDTESQGKPSGRRLLVDVSITLHSGRTITRQLSMTLSSMKNGA